MSLRTRVYATLPSLASAHEQGFADFEAPTWFAVFLPRGASEPIIRKLNQAAFATADTPSVQGRRNARAPSWRTSGPFAAREALKLTSSDDNKVPPLDT